MKRDIASGAQMFLRFEGSVRFIPLLLLILAASVIHSPSQTVKGQQGTFDVRSYGAKGDGKTLDTEAINQAVEAAAAAGGGTVRFPVGTYLSFSIRLKSNVTLYLDAGAAILAA